MSYYDKASCRGHMESLGPECGRPWLQKPCHSLSYGILFWQKANGCMFSSQGRHPRPALLQITVSMTFLILACFSFYMLCGHVLLLEDCHASAIWAHTVRTTASACIPQRDNGKSDKFTVFSGEGGLRLQPEEPKNSLQLLSFSVQCIWELTCQGREKAHIRNKTA